MLKLTFHAYFGEECVGSVPKAFLKPIFAHATGAVLRFSHDISISLN